MRVIIEGVQMLEQRLQQVDLSRRRQFRSNSGRMHSRTVAGDATDRYYGGVTSYHVS